MRSILISAATLFLPYSGFTQQPSWHKTNSPPALARYDDISFLDENFGYAIDFGARILKTRDGGENWQVLPDPFQWGNRSVMFFDTLNGVIGDLYTNQAPDSNHIYKTSDGGNSWRAIPDFPGPIDQGICGMCRLNDSVGYAVGRWGGPASFFKTSDQGSTWTYTDLSHYMSGAVDVYFWSKDSGIVVGAYGPWGSGANYGDSGGIIMGTSNGGITWEVRHKINIRGALCWKISFPSAKIGYVSLEQLTYTDNTFYFLKTTTQGYKWKNMVYHTGNYYNAEGIGFLNDTLGWLAGGPTEGFRTGNGGETWVRDPSVDTIMDRFRKISDTVAFSSGENVYRYGLRGFVTSGSSSALAAGDIKVFPNPAIHRAKILLRIQKPAVLSMAIYDLNGKKIFERPAQSYMAGDNYLNLQLEGVEKGEYLAVFSNDKLTIARGLIIQ